MAENDTPPAGTPPADNNGGNGGEGTPKTFTQEDLNRIASETRKEEKAKADKAIEDAKKAAREEALKEAKMSEEERSAKAKQQEDEERAAKDRDIAIRENKLVFKDKLSEAKMPTTLVDIIADVDPKKMESNFDTLKKAFDSAVETAVADKLKGGKPPKDASGADAKEPEIRKSF
jgi:hypothetical protein